MHHCSLPGMASVHGWHLTLKPKPAQVCLSSILLPCWLSCQIPVSAAHLQAWRLTNRSGYVPKDLFPRIKKRTGYFKRTFFFKFSPSQQCCTRFFLLRFFISDQKHSKTCKGARTRSVEECWHGKESNHPGMKCEKGRTGGGEQNDETPEPSLLIPRQPPSQRRACFPGANTSHQRAVTARLHGNTLRRRKMPRRSREIALADKWYGNGLITGC